MQLSNKRQRQLVRLVHLVIGGALGVLVYAPPSLTEGLRLVMQIGVFPIVVLSGLWLWYGTRVLKRLRDHAGQDTAAATRPTAVAAARKERSAA